MIHFSRKDVLVVLIYALLIAVNFFAIDRLGFPDNAVPTVRLAVVLLNAFTVLYAYRGLLASEWHAFVRRKWTKWLIIVAAFLFVSVLIALLRRLNAGPVDVIEEAAIDVTQQDGDIKSMPLYAFIVSLVALSIPLLSAVTEEVIFRHVLMFQHSRNRVVLYTMWVLSSVAFGLIHFEALGSVAATVPYIFAGLSFGALYLWEKNIWYNIFAHLLFNGINVLTALVGTLIQRFM